VTDELFDGHRIRVLTIVDHFSRESLAIEVGQRFRGQDVARVLMLVGAERGLPKTIRVEMEPNLPRRRWINGLTLTASSLTSVVLASRRTTP
jgi:putative transposase